MIGSLLLLIVFIFFFITNNIKGVVAIIIISLMNDMFYLSFGFSLAIHFFISLVYIPKILYEYKFISTKSRRLIQPLYFEFLYLIILAIVFGYIFPWKSTFDYERTWGQRAEGRAIIQVFRLFAEFSLILLLLLWLNRKRITIDYLLKAVSVITIFTLIIALFDTSMNGGLKQIFFSGLRIIGDRFTGFNGEPRSFGRICSYVLLFLVAFRVSHKNWIITIGIWSAIIGLVLSISASAFILVLVWGLIYLVITRRYKSIVYFIFIIPILAFILNNNEVFVEQTQKKILTVLIADVSLSDIEKVNDIEPVFFQSFEVFDRAALNFLFNNPIFFLIGTGPNMISIPSSPFLTTTAYSIYEDRIDSVPHTFLINLISRSGVIGLILWIMFFFNFKNTLKSFDKEVQALFICLMVSYFIVNSSMFLLIIAILLFMAKEIDNKITINNI